MHPAKNRFLFGLVALVVLLGLWSSLAPLFPVQAQGVTPAQYKDFEDLKRLIGSGDVTIDLKHNPNAVSGRLQSIHHLFGKWFVLLRTTNDQKTCLVDVEEIAAMRQR